VKTPSCWLGALASVAVVACGGTEASVVEQSSSPASVRDLAASPTLRRVTPHVLRPPAHATLQASVPASPATISYHLNETNGGSCSPQSGVPCPGWIERGVNLYFIWYGNWSGSPAQTLLPEWAQNVGAEPYYDITTSYWDVWNDYVPDWVGYGGSSYDAYSQGTNLADDAVWRIVANAIETRGLPMDPWGLYFVLTSSDITHQSVCSTACGWHDWMTYSDQFLKYAIIPDMNTCPSVCPMYNTPNDPSADAMVNVMSHELAETVTDPLGTAWYGGSGMTSEVADLCAWDFGDWFTLSNGTAANIWLGDRYYLVQQLFHPDDSTGPGGLWTVNGHCALSNDGASAWQKKTQ
jgi:hypothetical protein